MIKEFRELSHSLIRQVFNQIPGISALAALIVGTWVASTFTTSPIKATLASWGLIKGGRHVVSSQMYQFLSVFLPILVAGIAAYLVQRALKMFRAQQMEKNIAKVAQLGEDVQALLQGKLMILEKAKEIGLVSTGEYLTKKANLYQTYSQILPTQIKEFLIKKLTG